MSTRITTGMVQRNILADLNNVSGRLVHTQTKVASGKEITRPSDDPFEASRALALREDLEGVKQYQRNVADGQNWQESSELALSSVTDSVRRARDLLIQGASDGTDPVSKASIAGEIDQIIAGIKQTANATYRGRYLFSGTDTDRPAYAAGADDAYKGNGSAIARQIGPGTSIEVNVLGSSVLGDGQAAGDDKLLHVLRDIADHLRSGDSANLQNSDLKRLDANADALLGVRALNGARTNRLDAAVGRLAQVEQTTLSQLSETEDADIAKTLIDLHSQQAAYQAALRAGASIVQSSLMDFLR